MQIAIWRRLVSPPSAAIPSPQRDRDGRPGIAHMPVVANLSGDVPAFHLLAFLGKKAGQRKANPRPLPSPLEERGLY